jgi:hypothetical protein
MQSTQPVLPTIPNAKAIVKMALHVRRNLAAAGAFGHRLFRLLVSSAIRQITGLEATQLHPPALTKGLQITLIATRQNLSDNKTAYPPMKEVEVLTMADLAFLPAHASVTRIYTL